MDEDVNSLTNFFSKFPPSSYLKKTIILSSGDDIRSVYFIKRGIARSFYIDENGNEFTINLLKPYSVFPLSAVLAGKNSSYNFEAFTDIDLNVVPVIELRKFLETNGHFKDVVIENFAKGLEGYLFRSFFLIKGSAMQKISSTIIMLTKRFGVKNGESSIIDLPVTHQDIADLSGTTRETASIHMGLLEKEKIISKKDKKIVVLKYEDLEDKTIVDDESGLKNLKY